MLALGSGKPILSHSWAVSAHNPAQALSHPSLFERHLDWARAEDTRDGAGVDDERTDPAGNSGERIACARLALPLNP